MCVLDMTPETTTRTTTNIAGGVLPWGRNTQNPSTENKHIDTTTGRKTTALKTTETKITITEKRTTETTEKKTTYTTDKTTAAEKEWKKEWDENLGKLGRICSSPKK